MLSILPACDDADADAGDSQGGTSVGDGGSGGAESTSGDDPETGGEMEYEACDYPDRSDGCSGVACASTPNQTELLTVIEGELESAGVSEQVSIVDVYLDEGVTAVEANYVTFHVRDGWFSAYRAVSFSIDGEMISDADRARWAEVLEDDGFLATQSVAPLSDVLDALESCDPGVVFDRCAMSFYRFQPEVLLWDTDMCSELITIDALTGELQTCEAEGNPDACGATG